MFPFSTPDKGMHLHCVLETKPFLLLKASVKNVCPHNEVILSLILVVVVVFCKFNVFLVRCIGCSVEESSLKSAFRHDLTTNMREGFVFLNSVSVCVFIFLWYWDLCAIKSFAYQLRCTSWSKRAFLRSAPEIKKQMVVEDRLIEENKMNWKEHSVLVLYLCLL